MTTSPRTAGRPVLLPLGIALAGLGLLAIIVTFVLFALGHENLPVWLNTASAVLLPLGFFLAVVAAIRSSRARPR